MWQMCLEERTCFVCPESIEVLAHEEDGATELAVLEVR